MFIQIDQASETPIYQQLRNQIVAGIAAGQLAPGDSLPSVRSLASDLGINLHTVNKAYALLRDEGYILMRGRAGATVAPPPGGDAAEKRLADGLLLLVAEFKAAGGERAAFEEAVRASLDGAYGEAGRTCREPSSQMGSELPFQYDSETSSKKNFMRAPKSPFHKEVGDE